MGIQVPIAETMPSAKKEAKKNCKPVPINKVEEYCEGEYGNTTLPIEYGEPSSVAILDSGSGVAIAIK